MKVSGRPVEIVWPELPVRRKADRYGAPSRVGATERTTNAPVIRPDGRLLRSTAGLPGSICRITNINMYGAAARQVAFKASAGVVVSPDVKVS